MPTVMLWPPGLFLILAYRDRRRDARGLAGSLHAYPNWSIALVASPCSNTVMTGSLNSKAVVKTLADAVCLVIAAVPASLCRLEALFSERGDLFVLFAQVFSLI